MSESLATSAFIEQLKKENAELRAEVERLKEAYHVQSGLYSFSCDAVANIRLENHTLRTACEAARGQIKHMAYDDPESVKILAQLTTALKGT